MVDIDQYPCDEDDCNEAYPHPLLREKHRVDEHDVPDADEIEARSPTERVVSD